MRYSVRCRNYKCKHRRTLAKHPFDYKDGCGPKCAACGLKKGWRLEPYHYASRKQCNCGGPIGRDGSYPHEPSHPHCAQNPASVRNSMLRAGVSEEDIVFELGGRNCETEVAPF